MSQSSDAEDSLTLAIGYLNRSLHILGSTKTKCPIDIQNELHQIERKLYRLVDKVKAFDKESNKNNSKIIVKKGSRELMNILKLSGIINYDNPRLLINQKDTQQSILNNSNESVVNDTSDASKSIINNPKKRSNESSITEVDKKGTKLKKSMESDEKASAAPSSIGNGNGKKPPVAGIADSAASKMKKEASEAAAAGSNGTQARSSPKGPQSPSTAASPSNSDSNKYSPAASAPSPAAKASSVADTVVSQSRPVSSSSSSTGSRTTGGSKPKTPISVPAGDNGNSNNSKSSRPKLWESSGASCTPEITGGHQRRSSKSALPAGSTWSCAVCTLENEMRARNCLACFSPRSSSIRPPPCAPSSSSSSSGPKEEGNSDAHSTAIKVNPVTHLPPPLHPYTSPKVGDEYQIPESSIPEVMGSYSPEEGEEPAEQVWSPGCADAGAVSDALEEISLQVDTHGYRHGELEAEVLRVLYLCGMDVSAAVCVLRAKYGSALPACDIGGDSLLTAHIPCLFHSPEHEKEDQDQEGEDPEDGATDADTVDGDAAEAEGVGVPPAAVVAPGTGTASISICTHAAGASDVRQHYAALLELMGRHWKDWNSIRVWVATCRNV